MAASRIFFVLFLITTVVNVSGQDNIPLLERQVTVSFNNERLPDVLRKIADAGKFNFSYKSSLIKKDDRITNQFTNKTVREILDLLFKGSMEYRERGKYVILVKSERTSARDPSVLSGYVVDEATGKRLKNVSVYDPVTLNSAVTDTYGYFKIEVRHPTGEEIKLAVKKSQYTDTLVVVPRSNNRLLNIPIRVDKDKMAVLADSVGEKIKRFWFSTKKLTQQAINIENISDTMYRKTQFGIVPFVGTNGDLSGHVINDLSLNLLGGYSLGNRRFEMAGLFNITRGNVQGFQGAGLFNGVGGEQHGVQLAGLANGSLDSVKGAQVAGLANINARDGTGVRVAGLSNFMLKGTEATLVAGTFNFVNGNQRRPQLAGLFNFTVGASRPAQIAGLFNFSSGEVFGAQIGGLFNVAGKDFHGVQVSGLVNIAPKIMRGAQVGVINFGKTATGVQLGVINVSKEMKGIPIGFLSFVGKGYHKLEISADEVFYTNVAFRTGVRSFYNILTAGANPSTFKNEKTLWTFGYGIGTAPKLTKWLDLNVDITANQIVDGNVIDEVNLINKVFMGLDFRFVKRMSVFAGVTLNGHVTKSTYDQYPEIFIDYTPDIIHDRSFGNDMNLAMWWGAKAGIRFF